jgi:hypothetical protein
MIKQISKWIPCEQSGESMDDIEMIKNPMDPMEIWFSMQEGDEIHSH